MQRQAIALNPHDPESLAQLGWRLVVRGQWEEGGTLLQEAIDRSVVVPVWYHETLAVALYLGGDLQRARDEAELGKEDCCPGYAILAITEAALGHTAAARAALDEALRQSPQLARDPVAYWANFQVAPEVIERLNAGLAKAGPAATADFECHQADPNNVGRCNGLSRRVTRRLGGHNSAKALDRLVHRRIAMPDLAGITARHLHWASRSQPRWPDLSEVAECEAARRRRCADGKRGDDVWRRRLFASFSGGTNGSWRNVFREEDLALYDAKSKPSSRQSQWRYQTCCTKRPGPERYVGSSPSRYLGAT